MILDALLVVVFIISILSGRKTGLFLTVARVLSLLAASLLTALFGKNILAFLESSSLYDTLMQKLVSVVEKAVKSGETVLLSPFLEKANMVSELAAKGIADMIFSAIIFVAFSLLVRILIRLINKFICHLPLVGSANRFLGMAVSFLFTLVISYLVIGLVGGAAMCSEVEFIKEQMTSSVLIRYMYENNIVLNLFS